MKRLIITTLCLIFSTTLAFASGKSLGTDSNISFDSDQITSSTTDIDFVSENLITTGTGTLGALVVDTNTLIVNAVGYEDRVGVGTITPDTILHVKVDNATPVIRSERNDTSVSSSDIVARWEVETKDDTDPGIAASIEALSYGASGETGWRFKTGTPSALVEVVQFDPYGSVGIGTPWPDSPATLLQLKHATDPYLRFTRDDATVAVSEIIGKIEFDTLDSGDTGVAAYIKGVADGVDGEVALNFATGTNASIADRMIIHSSGSISMGDGTNQTVIGNVGTITLEGEATVWEDLRFPASSVKRIGNSDPDWEVFQNGVYALAFADSVDEEVMFTVQIPHEWKLGSSLSPHAHWSPDGADTGSVTWALEYSIADIMGTFPTTTTITTTDAGDGVDRKHQYADFSDIDMSIYTDTDDVSIIIMCRLYKDVDNGDDFSGDAFLLEIDFHYEIDSLGSGEETSK